MTRRSREFWVGQIETMKTSGLDTHEFAELHGLSPAALQQWIYRLRREARERQGLDEKTASLIQQESAAIPVGEPASAEPVQSGGEPGTTRSAPAGVNGEDPNNERRSENIGDPFPWPRNGARPAGVGVAVHFEKGSITPNANELEILFSNGARLRFTSGTDVGYVQALAELLQR